MTPKTTFKWAESGVSKRNARSIRSEDRATLSRGGAHAVKDDLAERLLDNAALMRAVMRHGDVPLAVQVNHEAFDLTAKQNHDIANAPFLHGGGQTGEVLNPALVFAVAERDEIVLVQEGEMVGAGDKVTLKGGFELSVQGTKNVSQVQMCECSWEHGGRRIKVTLPADFLSVTAPATKRRPGVSFKRTTTNP